MPLPSLFRALVTSRLRLERIVPAHADLVFEALQDPSLYAYYAGGPPSSVATLHGRYAMLADGRSPEDDRHWLNWTVFEGDTERAVGLVQATVEDDFSDAVIGYDVFCAARRRGFGREAVGAVRDHLVNAGVRALRAVIDIRNAPSERLVRSLDFRLEKTLRSDDVIAGVRGFDHHYVYRPPASP